MSHYFTFFLLLLTANSYSLSVLFLVPEKSDAYLEAVDKIVQLAAERDLNLDPVISNEIPTLADPHEYIVTFGARHLAEIRKINFSGEIISIFIPPNRSDIDPEQNRKTNHTLISSGVNLESYIELVERAKGKENINFGIFIDHKQKGLINQINQLKKKGVKIHYQLLKDDHKLITKLKRFIKRNEIDVFIVTPSETIYNNVNISHVFYQLFIDKVISISFTKRLVENGVGSALSLSYSDNDIIEATAEALINLTLDNLKSWKPKKYIFPEKYRVSSNPRLAKQYLLSTKEFVND